ncbi:MAG: NAD-dependent succinate-semialdehyde dehydrogenase [Chloroflexi bacterium]|jgi:succinate-semialdehyde dehydrogenase/glutarate-semialdehyde dehydrogenase|nr:NAD-dependent succinate-semialdehyde dehydrogenase [Chloroflexota bacterium]
MSIRSVNPANGELLGTFDPLDAAAIQAKVQLAERVADLWASFPIEQRAEFMHRVGRVLEEDASEWARQISLEMGKPITPAIAEVRKCAFACHHMADHAAEYLREQEVATEATRSYVRYDPLGVLLAIMPWNFPFWQFFRFAAPALMAGNVALLKHASNVPGCALAIEECFRRAEFPTGVVQTLLIGADQVAEIIANPIVRAVALTGSTPAGAQVAALAGREIKKVVLELGGSDPFIVMPSADLAQAIRVGVQARTVNTGQSCIAAKRFIIHESVANEFEQGFIQRMAELEIGDPLDPETQIGPLATPAILQELDEQVQASISQGARLRLGGHRLDRPGNYYAPTVLTDVPRNSAAYREETFGPVAALFRVGSVAEALALANDTSFGLGASVWTNDPAEQEQFIAGLQAGCVFVNEMVASDPRLPFGGVKLSGIGRELGKDGIHEFVNTKMVWIN